MTTVVENIGQISTLDVDHSESQAHAFEGSEGRREDRFQAYIELRAPFLRVNAGQHDTERPTVAAVPTAATPTPTTCNACVNSGLKTEVY